VCDHDVDARVAARLRKLGHDAWTAAQAGLSRARDDELTVYADDQRAVLISHDSEFSQRRRRSVVGRHIFLQCNEWDAADVLERHLDFMLSVLDRHEDVYVRVSPDSQPKLSFLWE
jgi:predicted nuclease of predicted toxin-antitoxin system